MIVDEMEIEEQVKTITENLEILNDMVCGYIKCLKCVSEETFLEGAVAQGWKEYMEYAVRLDGHIKEIQETFLVIVKNYVLAVNNGEQYEF